MDAGSMIADGKLEELQNKVKKVYRQAYSETQDKLRKYLKSFESKNAVKMEMVASGAMSESQYAAWKVGQELIGKRWEEMLDVISEDYVNADRIAAGIINGTAKDVYALGHNYGTFEVEKGALIDTSYTLYDRDTVSRLLKNEPDLLPQAKVDAKKSKAWNQKQITSAVTQGILQGESAEQVAERLKTVAGMDANSAMRSARTALTGAENAGRLASWERANKLGIHVRKEWLATLDTVTRHSHRELDGEVREYDEKFSNGMMYPGDPSGRGEELWNCRCTMVANFGAVDITGNKPHTSSKMKGMTYQQWQTEHVTESEKQAFDDKRRYMTVVNEMNALTKQMASMNDVFIGIWKQAVTLDDWEEKKSKVPAKIEYFDEKLAEAIESGNDEDIKKFRDLLDSVVDFDRKGERYWQLKEKANALSVEHAALKKKLQKAGAAEDAADDAYSEERKASALSFKDSRKADDAYRAVSGQVWQSATSKEKRAAYGYTGGSGRFNRPLSGFQKPYFDYGSGWEPDYFKGNKAVWIDYEDSGDDIRALTDLISRSSYKDDAWFFRGCDYNAIASFLGLDEKTLSRMGSAELQNYVGTSNRIYSFLSTATAEGRGFADKPVQMKVYAPGGSEMLYVEPFSAYSGAYEYRAMEWDGIKTQHMIGNEAEMLLQRGGMYTLTKAEVKGGKLYIEMELHPEQGYDLFQQDPSEWTGSTEKYK